MAWRLAKSLETLRTEANAAAPNRSKLADGTIGDTAHARSASDHNPNTADVVCALDLTHDPDNGADCHAWAETIRQNRHSNVKYVIWTGQMFSAYARGNIPRFTWRPYTGSNPHTSHMHISVGLGRDGRSQPPYDDESSWGIVAIAAPTPAPASAQPEAPPYPLPSGWYFGPRSGPRSSVSGFHGHGDDLAVWQQRMADRGWRIDVDGRYGPQTAGVALAFQLEKGLAADSLIGPETWAAAWTAPIT